MERERVEAFKGAVESGAVAAWLSGKQVQFRYRGGVEWCTDKADHPSFDSPLFYFRPAPEPERKPITPAEAFDLWGAVIHDKNGKRWRVLHAYTDNTYLISEDGCSRNALYNSLLTDGWTHNGEPICSRL